MSANPTLNPYSYTKSRAASPSAPAAALKPVPAALHKVLDTALEAVKMEIDWRTALHNACVEGASPTEAANAKFLVWETFRIAEDALAAMRA
jgi:hypothetical protein